MRSLRLLILPSLLGLWFSGQAGAETGATGEVRFSSAPVPPTELQVRLARERPAALFGVHALGLQREGIPALAAQFDQGAERLQCRIAAGQRDQHRPPTGERPDPGQDLGRGHGGPFAFVFRQHGVERVAPRTAVVAAAGAHEGAGSAYQRPLALDGGAKNLADQDVLGQGVSPLPSRARAPFPRTR